MARTNVVVLPTPARKRSFTTAEALIEEVRNELFRDGGTVKEFADKVGVSPSTIANLRSGKTRWPRPTTLFPLLKSMDLELKLVRRRGE